MNTSYKYEHFESWVQKKREITPAPIEVLVKKLAELPEDRKTVDSNPEYRKDREAAKKLPEYHYKAGCVNVPEIVGKLRERGLHYESLEMGAVRWLVVTPQELYEKQEKRVPLLLVFHKEDYSDPYWAMKTRELFRDYNDAAAEKKTARSCTSSAIMSSAACSKA